MRSFITLHSKTLRRIGYAAFSAFIAWHVVAITIVGPFSKSYLRDGLMQIFGGYLDLTELNRGWPFYAPDPSFGRIMRYQTIAADGKTTLYPLTQAREKFDHAYFRYTNFYFYLFDNPRYSKTKHYDKSVARFLCRRHQNEGISAINFIVIDQSRFTYLDYQKGARPLDQTFLNEKQFGPYPCTGNANDNID